MSLSTPTTDGGRVESFVDSSAGSASLHVQKYDASGQKVGAELTFNQRVVGPYDVAALSGGGYAMVYQSASPGGSWGQVSVQDASGAVIGQASTAGGMNFHLTAAQDGGFLVSYQGIPSDQGLTANQPLVQLYDPTGQSLTHGHIELAGQITSIAANAGGAMAVNWDDGGTSRTLTLDPATAAALATPATPTVTVHDDVGAQTGAIVNGATTDDTTPTFRIAVSQTGEAFVELDKESASGATYQNHGGGVAITAADVARGYVDITLPTSGDGHYLAWARVADASGSASYPVALDFTVQAASPPPAAAGQTLSAQHAGDVVTGTAGADTITAGDGVHALFGQDGDDSISGGAGFDVVNGNKGDDTIAGHLRSATGCRAARATTWSWPAAGSTSSTATLATTPWSAEPAATCCAAARARTPSSPAPAGRGSPATAATTPSRRAPGQTSSSASRAAGATWSWASTRLTTTWSSIRAPTTR